MTVADAPPLLRAIVAGHEDAVVEALRGMPEAERRGLAPELLRAARRGSWETTLEIGRDGGLAPREDREAQSWHQFLALDLALLGTATPSELRKLGATHIPFSPEPTLAVLVDRQPAWLEEWITWAISVDRERGRWTVVRGLVHAGLIDTPREGAYIEQLINAAGDFYDPANHTADALLDEDPALLEDEIWRLFEVEGELVSLRAADQNSAAGWREAIMLRVADGRLPRDRVLDATLDALARDFSAHRCSWYLALWKALKVTREERAARRERLTVLTSSAAAPVVGFAARELLAVARTDALPAEVLPALEPLLGATAQGTAANGLKLLDELVRGDPGLVEPAAMAVAGALGHDAATIQEQALDRLERWAPEPSVEVRERVLWHVDVVAATLRPRVEALLGISAAGVGTEPEERGPDAARIAAVPPAVRAALALEPLDPVPIPPPAGEPVLDPELELAPIASLDELAEAIGACFLDWLRPPDERLVDGVLRFCGEQDAFERELRPIAARIDELPGVDGWDHALAAVWAWRKGEVPSLDASEFPRSDESGVWHARLRAASARAARGDARRLLALPTHRGGWIAPAALVDRLRQVGGDVDDVELAQALLRLAPDGRAAALATADDLPGPTGAALRGALGGPPVADEGPAQAAARAVRAPPLDEHGELRLEFHLNEKFPAASVVSGVLDAAPGPAGRTPGAGEPVAELLGDLRSEQIWGYQGRRPALAAWPAWRDLASAAALKAVGWNRHALSSYWDREVAELLELLQSPGEPMTAFAHQFVVLALGSGVDREHRLALDLLIAAISDGRADTASLLPAVRAQLGAGVLLPGRLGPRLAALASAGSLQRATARDLLDRSLDVVADDPPRNLATLLEPFDELCAQTGTGVRHAPTRDFLASLSGGSKASKLARALLARQGEPPASERDLAAEARLRRAERWVRLAADGG